MIGDQRGLLGLVLLGHFLGIAAGGLGGFEFLVLNRDEFRAKAHHLLLGRRPHIGRSHNRAKPARRRYRLQAGNAGAHDKNSRGGNRAGGGHHHRQRTAERSRRVDHRAIARQIGLARQHIHDLRPRNARQQLERKGDDASLRHRTDRVVVAVRIHHGDDDGALFHPRQFRRFRPAHLKHDVGIVQGIGHDRSARRRVIAIENAGFDAGARLYGNRRPQRGHLLDGFGGCSDARLARLGLGNHRNLHKASAHARITSGQKKCNEDQDHDNHRKRRFHQGDEAAIRPLVSG